MLFCYLSSFGETPLKKQVDATEKDKIIIPESVNFHFTRQCNYECRKCYSILIRFTKVLYCLGGFCFHTAKTSFLLPLAQAKRGLQMLADEGMKKVNFSGGEPFLIQKGKVIIASFHS